MKFPTFRSNTFIITRNSLECEHKENWGHLLFSDVFLMPRTVSDTYQMFGYYILNEWIVSEWMFCFTTLNTNSLLNSLKVFYSTWSVQNCCSQTIATLFCITVILKNINWLLVQGSQIKGHELDSCKSTKIANRCWMTINRRMLELTRKRYPMLKDKEEAAVRW